MGKRIVNKGGVQKKIPMYPWSYLVKTIHEITELGIDFDRHMNDDFFM